jgi:ribosomal protein S15P/S13E
LKNGIYLLPTDLYNETEAKLADFTGNILPPLLSAVETDYSAATQRAQQELADMFNPADYLPVQGFMARIAFSWSYLQFGVSEALRQISREAFSREQEKLEMQMKEGSAEIRKILRLQWQEMVNHMVDRLTDEDGKKKVFRNSMLDKINDAISVFNPRNLSEDSDLALLVNQAQQMLNGVSPEQLRSDEAIRRNLQQSFSQMKQQLDCLVEEEADRQIRFS